MKPELARPTLAILYWDKKFDDLTQTEHHSDSWIVFCILMYTVNSYRYDSSEFSSLISRENTTFPFSFQHSLVYKFSVFHPSLISRLSLLQIKPKLSSMFPSTHFYQYSDTSLWDWNVRRVRYFCLRVTLYELRLIYWSFFIIPKTNSCLLGNLYFKVKKSNRFRTLL